MERLTDIRHKCRLYAGDNDGFRVSESRLRSYIQAATHTAVIEGRISELMEYPLNWAQNRKDDVWEKMILSRIIQLQKSAQLSTEATAGKPEYPDYGGEGYPGAK